MKNVFRRYAVGRDMSGRGDNIREDVKSRDMIEHALSGGFSARRK